MRSLTSRNNVVLWFCGLVVWLFCCLVDSFTSCKTTKQLNHQTTKQQKQPSHKTTIKQPCNGKSIIVNTSHPCFRLCRAFFLPLIIPRVDTPDIPIITLAEHSNHAGFPFRHSYFAPEVGPLRQQTARKSVRFSRSCKHTIKCHCNTLIIRVMQ